MNSYPIPKSPVSIEYEIKRSRFICDIVQVSSKEEAITFIEQVRQREPEARHHCWAYIAGHPESCIERGCSDDGEPSGTAGKPMLNVLQHKGIGEIVAVVSRYFGGIKLGAGGLVRAYGTAVQQGIDALELSERISMRKATVRFPFAMENSIRHQIERLQIDIQNVAYQSDVCFTVTLACGRESELEQSLVNASHGTASVSFPDN